MTARQPLAALIDRYLVTYGRDGALIERTSNAEGMPLLILLRDGCGEYVIEADMYGASAYRGLREYAAADVEWLGRDREVVDVVLTGNDMRPFRL